MASKRNVAVFAQLANVFISNVLTKLRLGFGSWLVTVDLFAIFAGSNSLKDLISGKF